MRKSNREIIGSLKDMIMVEQVEEKYKSRSSDFTRNRKLPFKLLVLFMLRKLFKSLTLELSAFFQEMETKSCSITKSAFTQARQKLSEVFFQDLLNTFNQEFYTDNQQRVRQLEGKRIVAVDGSTLDLPYSRELADFYGTHSNQHQQAAYVKGRVSLMYDLLNGMVLDGVLQPFAQGEAAAAVKHLAYCGEGDLLVYDRGYASFDLVYTHRKAGLDVLMRMKASFSEQLQDFARSEATDVCVFMKPGKNQSLQGKAYDKDTQEQVRLVKFTLGDGEQAFLLTTLLDKDQFPVDFLQQVYGMRWGVETRYDVLKNVLQVENFSGLTQKALLQDFYISLFLMNMQVLLSDELETEIEEKYGHRKHAYQVNTSVAIGHLKSKLVRLFTAKSPQEILLELKQAFLRHVEPVRPGRKYPRHKDKYRNKKKPMLMKNRKSVL